MLRNVQWFRPSLRQVLFGGVGSSIGVLGVLLAIGLYVVEVITRPKKRGIFDEYTFSPFELGLPAENVTFAPISGDYRVSGWFVAYPGATTTILVCPGYRTGKADMLGISTKLWNAGHNVLIFEYYGHGTDIASVTLGYRELKDFLGAVAYAKERAPQTHLGVMAYSMGASIAIIGSTQSKDIEALVLDSAFASHWSVIDYHVRRAFPLPSAPFVWMADQLMWWRAKYHFHQVEPLRDIRKLAARPVLLIHGGKDSIVDPHDATLLYEAAGEPKELWFFPEAEHCGAYFVNRVAYCEKVTAFFELYLKKPRLQLVEPEPEEKVSHPTAEALILTHIFEKDLDKCIDKAEVLLISTIRVALPGSFAKLICKMWVRIRLERQGLPQARLVNGNAVEEGLPEAS